MFPWPLALCQTDEPDSVWIGGKTGVSCKIGAVTTDDQNKMTQSSTAIIGIFKSDQPGMRWTAMTNGDIMSGPSIATDVIEDKKRTKVLWSGTGYEKRIKVIPASDHGTFWCLTAIESHQGLTVSLISEKQQALILDEKQYFSDIAISSDFTLFASSGSSIKIFHFEGQQWKLLYSCLDSSKLIAFTGDKKFLVAVHGGWLRVRAISPGLPLITSCHLSGKIICLAVKNRNIAAGLLSGDIVSLILETEAIHIK